MGTPEVSQNYRRPLTFTKAAAMSSVSKRSLVSLRFNLNPTCRQRISRLVTYLQLDGAGPVSSSGYKRLAFNLLADGGQTDPLSYNLRRTQMPRRQGVRGIATSCQARCYEELT